MSLRIRPATRADLDGLGRMGAAMVSFHHQLAPNRFMAPPPQVESGYAQWLGRELASNEVVLLVAELDQKVVGYAYGREEGTDWELLRERCGVFIDLWVDPTARGHGAGEKLTREMISAFRKMGLPRVVLMAASNNPTAQRLFARIGWQPTMVEMTLELEGE
jgi:ribosomal protein S18 acetylase RimI-like enzyme